MRIAADRARALKARRHRVTGRTGGDRSGAESRESSLDKQVRQRQDAAAGFLLMTSQAY